MPAARVEYEELAFAQQQRAGCAVAVQIELNRGPAVQQDQGMRIFVVAVPVREPPHERAHRRPRMEGKQPEALLDHLEAVPAICFCMRFLVAVRCSKATQFLSPSQ